MAIGATAVGTKLPDVPAVAALPLGMVMGAVGASNVSLILTPLAWWIMRSSGMGFRLHAVGESFDAAAAGCASAWSSSRRPCGAQGPLSRHLPQGIPAVLSGIPIGAAYVVDGKVIGTGHNKRVQRGSATLHGETDCLENVGRPSAARRPPVGRHLRQGDHGHDALAG